MTFRIHALALACGTLAAALYATAAIAAPAAQQPAAKAEHPGTTIISGQESPIGLYITPWKNAFTKQGMYSPANHRMQIVPEPVDPDTFHLQTVYYDTIQAYRARQLDTPVGHKPATTTPAVPPPAPPAH